jgi:hypothetical protein
MKTLLLLISILSIINLFLVLKSKSSKESFYTMPNSAYAMTCKPMTLPIQMYPQGKYSLQGNKC